jgi:phosphoribosyl 1,2-cyclic phosphodiesterase
MVELISLGSGGGRYMTINQVFKTGGFRLHAGVKLHVDPGPGALLLTYQNGLNPLDLDCVVVTHCHPDHYNDGEVLVEAMTDHMTRRRGVLVGSESVLRGKEKFEPAISLYHQSKVEKIICVRPNEVYELGDIRIEATPTQHSDPTTFGLRFHTNSGIIGYTNDTQYFNGLSEHFRGCRVLIGNVTRPLDMRIRWHLCSEDFISLLKHVKPELAIMVHMGMLFLKYPPEKEAARIKAETGVETLPGHAGLRVKVDEKIEVKRPIYKPTLETFARKELDHIGAE